MHDGWAAGRKLAGLQFAAVGWSVWPCAEGTEVFIGGPIFKKGRCHSCN
jgi:hypothetical protein